MSRQRRPELFVGERVLVRQIPAALPYCILATKTTEYLINDNNSMIIMTTSESVKLSYILAVINSKLISFWFAKTLGKLQRKIFPQFKVHELSRFPIKITAPENQLKISDLVEKIQETTNFIQTEIFIVEFKVALEKEFHSLIVLKNHKC